MKQVKNFSIVHFFLIIISCSCCKKVNEIPEPAPILPKMVEGKWKWVWTRLNGPISSTNPVTSLNSNYSEKIEFFGAKWKFSFFGVATDSGTYNLEHKRYVNSSNYEFIYDQINYYRLGLNVGEDYYNIIDDTLINFAGYSGSFTSFNVQNAGSMKKYVRE